MTMKRMHRFAALYQEGDSTVRERKEILLTHVEHLKHRRAELDRCEQLLARKLALYEAVQP